MGLVLLWEEIPAWEILRKDPRVNHYDTHPGNELAGSC